MHQPDYQNALTGEYALPWVRLHGAKDYLHMIEVLADFPQVHATFNFVPSLIEQLLEYAQGRAQDRWLALSLQESWTREEKAFILTHFFSLNWERVVQNYPPYARLLQMRETSLSPDQFPDQYYRDVAAWFNLAWIDPNWLEQDRTLRGLVAKGSGYTIPDIQAIGAKQTEIIGRIIPAYIEMEARGQIELTSSPYYHPILPLLVDNRLAREASPALPLPRFPFTHPEDARHQMVKAIAYHREKLGRTPRGMWPPEGGVSQSLLGLIPNEIQWIASDEGILARSLGRPLSRDGHGYLQLPHLLYRPYWVGDPRRRLAMIFRDRSLSDRIGFVYKDFEGKHAAADLVHRLHQIRQTLPEDGHAYLVSIILDGENAWEAYEHNGDVFLRHLYGLLSDDPLIKPVTVSEYLALQSPLHSLARLATGSWINADLETWIGESAHNHAWESLALARQHLVTWQAEHPEADPERLAQAWEEIYIAEGSDWFWWYSSRNNSGQDHLFDAAFRNHLANVYRLTGQPIPAWLWTPMGAMPPTARRYAVSTYITPTLQASAALLPDWTGAGVLEPRSSSGTMQIGATILKRLYYGYDPSHLYLRLESRETLASYLVAIYLTTPRAPVTNPGPRYDGSEISSGIGMRPAWELELRPGEGTAWLNRADGQGGWVSAGRLDKIAVGPQVFELAVPLDRIGVALDEALEWVVMLIQHGKRVETLPLAGHHRIVLTRLE